MSIDIYIDFANNEKTSVVRLHVYFYWYIDNHGGSLHKGTNLKK